MTAGASYFVGPATKGHDPGSACVAQIRGPCGDWPKPATFGGDWGINGQEEPPGRTFERQPVEHAVRPWDVPPWPVQLVRPHAPPAEARSGLILDSGSDPVKLGLVGPAMRDPPPRSRAAPFCG